VDIAIDAMKYLNDDSARLTISGLTDAEQCEVKAYSKSVGVEDRIYLRGVFMSIWDEIAEVKPSACLLPSRWEGLPLSLLEYSCLGVPVIITPLDQVRRLHKTDYIWIITKSWKAEHLAEAMGVEVTVSLAETEKYINSARHSFDSTKAFASYYQIARRLWSKR
jgi:glycosyltransferase involved in cell wall biosynthesis